MEMPKVEEFLQRYEQMRRHAERLSMQDLKLRSTVTVPAIEQRNKLQTEMWWAVKEADRSYHMAQRWYQFYSALYGEGVA